RSASEMWTPPAITRCVVLCALTVAISSEAWASVVCVAPSRSPRPTMSITSKVSPRCRTAAATSGASRPDPAMRVTRRMSLVVVPVPGQGQRMVLGFDDEFHHVLDQLVVRENCGGIVDPLPQRALGRKDHAVGGAQIVDSLAVEAAALEPDEVET